MPRWKKLQNWPESLQRMSIEELRAEIQFWRWRRGQLGHRDAKKECASRIRTVEKILQERLSASRQD